MLPVIRLRELYFPHKNEEQANSSLSSSPIFLFTPFQIIELSLTRFLTEIIPLPMAITKEKLKRFSLC